MSDTLTVEEVIERERAFRALREDVGKYLTSPDGRATILKSFQRVLATIKDEHERNRFVYELSKMMGPEHRHRP
ncbi:MAG: hypothetical protein U0441_00160 [Polyangiaceae bacterium]